MIEAQASRTALRVALRRAAHQIHDERPLVFEDPLAVTILGPEYREELARTPRKDQRPFSAALRAWMVARARYAEDILRDAVSEAGRPVQYVVLGAGLDTFAYRNPFPGVKVFEVDHPATQAWKLQRLAAAGIAVPDAVQHVPVDFEQQSLGDAMEAAGLDARWLTVTAWLGVVPYLTAEGSSATARWLGSLGAGSRVVFDYSQPREVLPPREQLMLDSLAARVAQAGEPFQLFFTPEKLRAELARAGLRVREDVGSRELTARYFAGRRDGLTLRGEGGRMCCAQAVSLP